MVMCRKQKSIKRLRRMNVNAFLKLFNLTDYKKVRKSLYPKIWVCLTAFNVCVLELATGVMNPTNLNSNSLWSIQWANERSVSQKLNFWEYDHYSLGSQGCD